ncbi:hypothetical protein GCM10019071_13810 [Sphingobium fuliginis]|uniref:Uncharacterized protein n=1 Tax=Sphingobium fuliginis (strain ATCC 27551) TaxID=336203 RepID=A0ABQ1EU86_SPHSA|nr:hypothetical protein GCM10019071_13810 [Sphingobium fuliginis]
MAEEKVVMVSRTVQRDVGFRSSAAVRGSSYRGNLALMSRLSHSSASQEHGALHGVRFKESGRSANRAEAAAYFPRADATAAFRAS